MAVAVDSSASPRGKRRLEVLCLTCSFAPDDIFFPILLTASIKGTWFLVSFGVLLGIFTGSTCSTGVPSLLKVSVIGFTTLQFIALVHKLIVFVASTRGTIRRPNHRFMRELILIGVVVYGLEVIWAVYNVVAVILQATTICTQLQTPVTAYVVIVWLNWLELALLALIYFSCLDRCKCFCCRAACRCRARSSFENVDPQLNVNARSIVISTSHNIDMSHMCSITREKLCTCRRDGLNNSKNIALLDVSHAMEVLFRDIDTHYTALDRLAGWVLVQKYHTQLLRQGGSSVVTQELLEATLHFLKNKGVLERTHEVQKPQTLEKSKQFTDMLLYYYWFAMAAYGWTVKVFLEPLSGICSLCRGARCSCCAGEHDNHEMDGVQETRGSFFQRSAEVANIAGIDVGDVFLGKTTNDIHCPPFYVCRTTRHDEVTGEKRNEVVIIVRGTLSVKDVMTNFTASMRDATKCQESLVEKWFLLLVKTKLSFLGVQDAYFHTGFYKSAKVILNILRRSNKFKNLVEKENYRVVVAGHSLGAGVGAILTLLIKQKHPHWANGLHAYLYSVPGAVCSYELARKAEELGIITSVVGAYDAVPRVSWRALTYLKILVKKALDETDLKKQEILCCGTIPKWDPPIFDRTSHPVGLMDTRSGAATPDLLELQDSLPVIRRSTWDQVSEKRKKREALLRRGEEASNMTQKSYDNSAKIAEDEDVDYQEKITEAEVDPRNNGLRAQEEVELSLGSVLSVTLGDVERMEEEDHLANVATEFLHESSQLGPLMFIPGRILHIEETEETSSRWCGVGLLGVRCCGVRCNEGRQVRASWKAREDLTGLILHHDCLLDHSPRRTLSMLQRLSDQMNYSGDVEETELSDKPSDTRVQQPHEKPTEQSTYRCLTGETQTTSPEIASITNPKSQNDGCFVEVHEL